MKTCAFCAGEMDDQARVCPLCGRASAGGGSDTPPAQTKGMGWLALGCAGGLLVVSLLMCGTALMIRQYRELTLPLTLVLGCAALALGWIAYRNFSRRE